jgi:hypothetical protein
VQQYNTSKTTRPSHSRKTIRIGEQRLNTSITMCVPAATSAPHCCRVHYVTYSKNTGTACRWTGQFLGLKVLVAFCGLSGLTAATTIGTHVV